MEYVVVSQKLPKQSVALAQGVTKFLLALDQALKDGFQVGQDVPTIVSAAIADIVPVLGSASGLPAEAAADPIGVGQAFESAGTDFARQLTGIALDSLPAETV